MEAVSSSRSVPSLLIVEDDRVICEMLATVIQRKFCDVTIYHAGNGQIGVDLFMKPIMLPTLFAAIEKCFDEIRGTG
jgi:hypothetical protein